MGIVDELLTYGANYYHINFFGQNLLHFACKINDIGMVRKVLSLNLDINHQDTFGKTPLMIATTCKNEEILQILLEHGADSKINHFLDSKYNKCFV